MLPQVVVNDEMDVDVEVEAMSTECSDNPQIQATMRVCVKIPNEDLKAKAKVFANSRRLDMELPAGIKVEPRFGSPKWNEVLKSIEKAKQNGPSCQLRRGKVIATKQFKKNEFIMELEHQIIYDESVFDLLRDELAIDENYSVYNPVGKF